MRHFLLLFLFPALLSAQDFNQAKVDSLKIVIANSTNLDSIVNCYKHIADEFYYYNNDSIIYYANIIFDIAEKYQNDDYKYLAYAEYGTAYWEKAQYEKAVDYYTEALEYHEGSGGARADTLMADLSYNLGLCYSDMSNYDKGLEYLNAAIQYFDNYENYQWKAHAYNGIGDIYVELENYDKALDNYNLALETLPVELDGRFDQGLIFGNLADGYFKMGVIDTSKILVKRAIDIYENENMNWGMAFCYGILSRIAMQEKEYNLSKSYANKSLDYSQEQGALSETAEAYLLMGKAGLLNNELRYALKYTQEGIKISEEANILSITVRAKEILAEIFEELGNYKKSYINYKEYTELKDSLFSMDKIEELNQVNLKAETAQKDAEIANKNLKIVRQEITRNYLIGGIGAISLLSLFFLNRFRLKQELTDKEVLLKQEKIENLEQKQKLLAVDYIIQGQEEERKRVAKDLHDGLGGILTTAKHQLSTVGKRNIDLSNSEVFQKAESLIATAHSEVRKIAHNMMPDALSNLGLQAAIEDLANQVNMTDELKVKTQIKMDQNKLTPNQEIVLYRVIQESINNALNHAEAKNLVIQMIDQGDTFHLAIEDDGQGFDIQYKQKREGIGIKSMESRVKYLNGNFDITSRVGEGTSIDVIIPTAV